MTQFHISFIALTIIIPEDFATTSAAHPHTGPCAKNNRRHSTSNWLEMWLEALQILPTNDQLPFLDHILKNKFFALNTMLWSYLKEYYSGNQLLSLHYYS